MANDPIQQNILIALQDIQIALRQRNNTPLLLFRGNTQNLIEWLDNFERTVTANQYDNEYKFQIISGYLQDSSATWFLQETNIEKQKIYSFTKELRTDLSYVLWLLLALKDNLTIDLAIELVQRIEDNQRMHLRSTLSVFASASVMTSAPQMIVISFATQTQDPNKQLIDKFTANLAQLLKLLA
ncbi:hypothetical protein G9A89_006118 [Geosiphon pyriformis]|nr:hypothetical protein G9A89_006118 [Geosiphon pyriformis]